MTTAAELSETTTRTYTISHTVHVLHSEPLPEPPQAWRRPASGPTLEYSDGLLELTIWDTYGRHTLTVWEDDGDEFHTSADVPFEPVLPSESLGLTDDEFDALTEYARELYTRAGAQAYSLAIAALDAGRDAILQHSLTGKAVQS